MMETVLTLPLYIVMIASLFWLGELCLGRLALTHGERLRLWENSDRYIDQNAFVDLFNPVEGVFWFLPNQTATRNDVSTGVSLARDSFPLMQKTANGWGQIHSGNLQIDSRRSLWSWGIENFFRRNLWNFSAVNTNSILGSDILKIVARGNVENPLDSSLLSRQAYLWTSNDSTHRENDNSYKDSLGWITISQGRWDDFVRPTVTGANSHRISSYSRVYEAWSQ